MRAYLSTRVLGLVLCAAFVLVAPATSGTPSRLSAGLIALLGVPIVWMIEQRLRADRRDRAHVTLNLVQVAAIAAVMPEHWYPMMVVWVALSMTMLGTSTRAREPRLVLGVGAALLASGLAHQVSNAASSVIAAAVMFLLSDHYYRAWGERRAEIDDRYTRLVSSARLFFWEIDIETELITEVTGDLAGTLGWDRDDVIGEPFRQYLVDDTVVDFEALPESELDLVIEMRHRDGSTVPIRHQMKSSGDGRLQAAASDVTDLTVAAEQMRHQSEHDELTGLLNRQGLLNRIEQRLSVETDLDHCLVVIDLVRFKEVNDAFGHTRGDEVLAIIGDRLRNEASDHLVARLGGNEFAVFLAGPHDGHCDSAAVVQKLGDVVRRPVAVGGAGIAIRASLGYAPAKPGVTPIELLRQADVAVHEAKINSLASAQYEPTPTAQIVERLRLAAQLDRAIDEGEFRIWLQPKVSLLTGELVGAEALARWHHPELGVLNPERFVGLVEISEAYHRFSDEMIEQALQVVDRCRREWPTAEIAVNLHPRSFDEAGLVERVENMLLTHQISAHSLKLEITEVDALAENGRALEVFHRLREVGVGISVDDFGTGHSSLNRLRIIEPTEVKLDQSFVRNAHTSPHDQTIIASAVQLAASLGISCVAEGVETAAACAVLRSLGCDVVQGYLFGRPMPVEDFLAQLRGEVPAVWLESLSRV